ncbi:MULTISPECIES: ABC transporter ATP-binding protein [unclassified Enterococcus]|uniref:ABC transporter ATP-binding protein n=1 Tax=unclassified Enterococcus TaxID=2608891 RepID=UPI001905E519|nr:MULTISPECIES: ABC transporter ATP-binding protein [unclassified Enterococcus]MBK0038961.1 ABC transporter ATP-binding protein [Enterococcus sp. S52]MBK0071583.1 ABC transporter ATP-binding protein [Enterococcus sp. S53]MBK0140747.1 ABC transporter ATP-binding protein [Enterococcus sp. S76]MBK0145262.1 ABC transporter ATP-binding protein [Enterococcus sp. S77]
MKQKIIQFTNFSFQYDAQVEPTLKNIDLTIYEGEKVLIVGASGSGKSTLGKCLNGLIPQNDKGSSTGELTIGTNDFGQASIYELSLTVGTVLQDTDSQFVGLTVAEDIVFSLENDQRSQAVMQEALRVWAEKTDLMDHLAKKPQELSGGQKQRVSMAGVLIDETPILLFDEPLANLDPQTGVEAIKMIDQLYQEKRFTTIIIEHRLEEVLAAAVDRIIVMEEGRILADSTPNELLKTDMLQQVGIREPLYLAALKKAGVPVTDAADLVAVEAFASSEIAEKLTQFQEKFPKTALPSHQPPLLEAKNLSFSYQVGKPILQALDFTIHQGEMISLVGHNGAGKSTLSHLITGFLTPTSGKLLWQGTDMGNDSIKERAQKIGYVLQNSNQMLSKNFLFDEVALGLRNRNVPEAEITEKVHQTLKICGLYPFRSWPLSALSHGQKRRAAIAAILVLDPELILLDEPTAGQDYRHYTEMMQFLQELNQRGLTIVMITHDMHLMLEYTQRTIVLTQGTILLGAPPEVVLADKQVVSAANLKETSLYTLATLNQLTDPAAFTAAFIASEKEGHDGE